MSQVLKEILLPVSAGDFVDRYSISLIKQARGVESPADEQKRLFAEVFPPFTYENNRAVIALEYIRTVNEFLWDTEDMIRQAVENEDDSEIARLSRDIITLNDRRAEQKRNLDQKLGYRYDKKKYSGSDGYEI